MGQMLIAPGADGLEGMVPSAQQCKVAGLSVPTVLPFDGMVHFASPRRAGTPRKPARAVPAMQVSEQSLGRPVSRSADSQDLARAEVGKKTVPVRSQGRQPERRVRINRSVTLEFSGARPGRASLKCEGRRSRYVGENLSYRDSYHHFGAEGLDSITGSAQKPVGQCICTELGQGS